MLTDFTEDFPFPDPRKANPDGIVAAGGDLLPERILAAYQQGIFPWFSEEDPILWWSLDPRGIIPLDAFRIGTTLRKAMRKNPFEIRINTAFEDVMRACSHRPDSTDSGWIHEPMISAYLVLHQFGYAHSVEAWRDDKLAGGLYGVTVGGLFAGESMFYRETNASKVALVALVERMKERGYALLDCQMITDITKSMGAMEISRDDYLQRLKKALLIDCTFQD